MGERLLWEGHGRIEPTSWQISINHLRLPCFFQHASAILSLDGLHLDRSRNEYTSHKKAA